MLRGCVVFWYCGVGLGLLKFGCEVLVKLLGTFGFDAMVLEADVVGFVLCCRSGVACC